MKVNLFLINKLNNNISIDNGISILHNCVKNLIINPYLNVKYDFWPYDNYLQFDRGEKKVDLGEMGYLSGLFKIFDNNSNYCILIVKNESCRLCHISKSRDIFKKV